MNMLKVLMAAIVTMALVGCGTTTRARVYSEPETPAEQKARVRAAVEATRPGPEAVRSLCLCGTEPDRIPRHRTDPVNLLLTTVIHG